MWLCDRGSCTPCYVSCTESFGNGAHSEFDCDVIIIPQKAALQKVRVVSFMFDSVFQCKHHAFLQIYSETTPQDARRTDRKPLSWGRVWGDVVFTSTKLDPQCDSYDANSTLNFHVTTSAVFVVRLVCSASSKYLRDSAEKVLGEARFLPAAGMYGSVVLPLINYGSAVVGTVSLDVFLAPRVGGASYGSVRCHDQDPDAAYRPYGELDYISDDPLGQHALSMSHKRSR